MHNESLASTGIVSRYLEQSFSSDSVAPTTEPAEEYFHSHSRMLPPKSVNNINNNTSDTANNNNCNSTTNNSDNNDRVDCTPVATLARPHRIPNDPPPPLPPKPKLLPSSSSWPLPGCEDSKLKNCRARRAVYLDQPSSSFV